MTTKLSVVKNLLLIFVIGNLSFVIYSYNLKPLLSANYANQILSLPASDAAQAAVLLKDALALNSNNLFSAIIKPFVKIFGL